MNELRNRFLVEVGEGGCWHITDGKWQLCSSSLGEFANRCLRCKEGFYARFPVDGAINPDFSKWENMGRLLELAVKKELGVMILTEQGYVKVKDYVRVGQGHKISLQKTFKKELDVPSILATLIAQALGWVEAKK